MWYNDIRPDSELINDRYSLIMLDSEDNYNRMLTEEDKKRTISNLLRLRKGILDKIPRVITPRIPPPSRESIFLGCLFSYRDAKFPQSPLSFFFISIVAFS